jgi:hypothetical protein
VLVEISLLDLR